MASLLVARLLRLPEPYWAPITTLVITQSSLGAALEVSKQRFFGTTLGAIVGAITATLVGLPQQLVLRILAFAIGIVLLGLLCQMVNLDRNGYRFGGVTLTIVLMIPRTGPAWLIAFQRFAGVSIGIATALLSQPCGRRSRACIWRFTLSCAIRHLRSGTFVILTLLFGTVR